MQALKLLKKCWLGLRSIGGDSAYERYLAHWQAHHRHQGGEPLSRAAFFKEELERKWSGVKRCC
jgi:uncharacterized short protein YbdD (DUF466 family)